MQEAIKIHRLSTSSVIRTWTSPLNHKQSYINVNVFKNNTDLTKNYCIIDWTLLTSRKNSELFRQYTLWVLSITDICLCLRICNSYRPLYTSYIGCNYKWPVLYDGNIDVY